MLISYTIGPYRLPEEDRPIILSAWLWILLFFASMSGLARTFIKEEETQTAIPLMLASQPEGVFLGKWLFNGILLGAMAFVLIPLYVVLMEYFVETWYYFLMIVLLGCVGLTTGTTLLGAIVAKATTKGTLFSILSFPVVLPLLLVAIQGTQVASQAQRITPLLPFFQGLIGYIGAMLGVSLLLFRWVWLD